jgi:hypothetical protein
LRALEKDLYDICLYRELWKRGYYNDTLDEEWSYKLKWGNITFSHVALFLIKALIEFIKGKNIVLLLPTDQLVNKKFYIQYLQDIVIIQGLGYFKFIKNGELKASLYVKPCCLVYFL